MIELKDVSVAFQGHSVLEHCSLLVPDGGHTAVMGPSGSGKTTLLRLMAGQLAPDQGSVTVSHGRIS